VKVGYVVLYVNDAEACRRFWVEQIGMVEKRRTAAGAFTFVQVGFADQEFAFELVPLELMKDNPDNLDLGRPRSPSESMTSRPRMPPSPGAGCRRPMSASTKERRASRSRTPRDTGSR
jgi:catechol 2,3-dioxygenase-like lactoylglutathione lyase family enzyme